MQKYVCVLVLVLAVAATKAAGAVGIISLPSEVYGHLGGDWGVEVHSPCQPLDSGTVTFNDTPSLRWVSGRSGSDIRAGETEGSLSFDGLRDFIVRSEVPLSYVMCESQSNYLSTPHRPQMANKLPHTYLREYSGMLIDPSAGETSCKSTGRRDVLLRVMGAPFSGEKADKISHNAIQYMELFIDTVRLSGRCNVTRDAAPSPDNTIEKKRRRRRGHRHSALAGTSGEEPEMFVEDGYVAFRFTRKSLPTLSFVEKYYPSMMFFFLFMVYRAVYSFSQKLGSAVKLK